MIQNQNLWDESPISYHADILGGVGGGERGGRKGEGEGRGNCYGTESSPEGVAIFSEALYFWRAG